MTPPKRKKRSGFTLAELLVAGAVFSTTTLATLELINVCTRVVRRNAILLEMDAAAFDLLWCMFNRSKESFDNMGNAFTESGKINLVWDKDQWTDGTPPVMEYRLSMQHVKSSLSSASAGKYLILEYNLEGSRDAVRKLEIFRSNITRNLK